MKCKKTAERVLSLVLAVAMAFSVLSVISFADKVENYSGKYGTIIPTDANMKAQKSSYTFYGNSTKLYFMMFSKGKANAWYAVEIYSDKNYSEDSLIASSSGQFVAEKDTLPLIITWKFKSNPSGTYYGRCYTYVAGTSVNTIDKSTVSTFMVKLNRIGKTTVSLNKAVNAVGGVKLSWVPLSTATKYAVYRKLSGAKSWTRITTLPKGSSSYKDTAVTSGKKYIYTVKAFDSLYSSLYNKSGVSVNYLATPTIKSVTGSSSKGYAKLSWSKSAGASGYYIYRKGGNLSDTSWTRIATVKQGTYTYTDKNSTSTNWCYNYTVRAYSGNAKSSYNSAGVEFNYIKAPGLKSASSTVPGIKLTWTNSNSLVNRYYIYRKAPGEKSWSKIGTSSQKTFTDTKVSSGKTYLYTVKSISSTNCGAYNGTGISGLYLAAPSLTGISINEQGVSTVKWKAVAGAKGYYVYRKVPGGKWIQMKQISGTKTLSYSDKTTKTAGEEYTYTVRAYSGSVKGAYSGSGISLRYLLTPELTLSNSFSEDALSEGINVSWSAVKGAESYTVYKKAAGDTDWTVIAENVTETSLFDSNVTNGTVYTYSVKAKCGKDESKSAQNTIAFINAPVLGDAVIAENGVKLSWATVEGADCYYIYRKAVGGNWEAIGSYSLNEFTDTSTEALTTPYIYSVAAGKGIYKSAFDKNGISNFIAVETASAVFNEPQSESQVAFNLFSWSENTDAESYEVYRSADGADAVKLAEVTSGNCAYEDHDILQGVTYTYSVKPTMTAKLGVSTSAESVRWNWPDIPAVDFIISIINPINGADAGIILSWNKTDAADGYEIYRKTADGEWSLIKTITSPDEIAFTDYDIDIDVEYMYSIKAVADDRETLFDETGKSVVILTPVEAVTGISASLTDGNDENEKNVIITWNAVTDATYYKIMRKADNGEWELLDTLIMPGEMTYTDTGITRGVSYSYSVIAVRHGRSSNWDTVGAAVKWSWPTINPPFPIAATQNSDGFNPAFVNLTWDSIDGAASYEIYRKTAEASEWTLLDSVDSGVLSYKDTDILPETTYYYSVKSVAPDRESMFDNTGVSAVIAKPLDAATNVTATLSADEQTPEKFNAVITFSAVEGAESYKIFRRTSAEDYTEVATILSTGELKFVDNTIAPDTEYIYTVIAVGEGHGSTQSNTAAVTWATAQG